MNRILAHISQFFQAISYRKIFLFGLVLCASYSFAANDPQNDSDMVRAIVQVLNFIFTVITFLLTPAVILAGWLLSPDWTMGDFFGLRPYFIQVWVLVSNLTYIIFALMLLYMAVMQIFSGESNYAFKKKLPRFLVGILMVPFTWLIVSWTLSFANQAVAAVLSIPSGAIANMQDSTSSTDKGFFHQRSIPTKFVLNFGEDSPGAGAESSICGDDGQTKDGKSKCISPAEFISKNDSGPFFIIMIYAYDIFKIQNTEVVNFNSVCGTTKDGPSDAKGCVNSIAKLARKFGVSLITTVFFAVILIALCWVLLARAFKLWVYVMFSPLFGLAYAVSDEGLGKTLESEGGGEGASLGKVGFVPFFQLAMVPVLVSAVLSFGILFIGVVQNTFTSGSLAKDSSGTFCTSGEFMVKYCIKQTGSGSDGSGTFTSSIIIGNETAKDNAPGRGNNYAITFEFGSMISDFVGNSAGKTVAGAAGGLAEAGTDIFAHIILSIIALAVMWMGVKAAVSYDEVTKKAFEPFAKFGDSVGNFVQHIPSYLPTPHPAFAALNPASFDAIATAINKNVDTTISDSRASLNDMISGTTSKIEAASQGFQNGTSSFGEFVKELRNGQFKDVNKARETLLAGLNRIESDVPDASKAEFSAFKKAVEGAKSSEALSGILSSDGGHGAIVAKLDRGDIGGDTFKGSLIQLGSTLGASSGSSSSSSPSAGGGALPGATIETGNVVRIGSTTVKGEPNETLPEETASKVKGALNRANGGTVVSRLANLDDDEIVRKSFDELFPSQNGRSPGDKKIIMKNLARASGIR